MAIKSNPTDWVQRWRNGVGAAGARFTSGVNNSSDWAANATTPQAASARATNWNAANSSGAIDRGIQRLGTQGWRSATVAKASNWQNGVNTQQAINNATAGAQRLFTYLGNAQNAIASVPRGGFQENMQRMVAHATSLHDQAQAFKQTG